MEKGEKWATRVVPFDRRDPRKEIDRLSLSPTKPKISRLITSRLIECRSSRGRASPLSISRRERERERESGFSVRIFRSHSYSCVGNSLPVGTAAGGRASPSSRTGFSLGYSVYTRGPLASNFRQRLFVVRQREGGRRVSSFRVKVSLQTSWKYIVERLDR